MKKSLVKILTVALAAATVAGMSAMPVFAAPTVANTWTATGTTAATTVKTVTVKGITESGVTVTAYQIVKGNYDAQGFWTSYTACDATNAPIADVTNPKAAEITAIANNIGSTNLKGVTMTKSGNNYVADVEAGLYLVLVTGTKLATVYNPALVAVNLTDPYHVAGTATGGEVDMADPFTYKDEGVATTAYVKSSEPGFNKDIVNSSMSNTEGDVVAYGDDVSFVLNEMTIPSYSQDYTAVKYRIDDQLDADAFLGIKSLTVKVAASTDIATAAALPASVTDDNDTPEDDTDDVTTTNYTLTLKKADGTATTDVNEAVAYTVEFTDAFIRANGGKAVEITYTSKLIDGTTVNYAEHKNTAKLSYSNNPTDATSVKEKTDTTYHYTFGIDADLDAQGEGDHTGDVTPYVPEETYELNKVTKGADTYTQKDSKKTSTKTQVSNSALAGALFGLYKTEAALADDTATTAATSTAFKTATSDENGHIQFKGLDTGTYYMKELAAPEDYSLNTSVYKIKITATLNDDGILTSYTIATSLKTGTDDDASGESTFAAARSATYTNVPTVTSTEENIDITTEGRVKNTINQTVNETEIINTKMATLPATGGVGTVAITIGAGIGMAGFMTLYITNKKKKKSEND